MAFPIMAVISAIASKKMGEKNPIFGQTPGEFEEGPAPDPQLVKKYGEGPIARPTFIQSTFNPSFANQIRSANMQYNLTPIQAQQQLDIAQQQLPVRISMDEKTNWARAAVNDAIAEKFDPQAAIRRRKEKELDVEHDVTLDEKYQPRRTKIKIADMQQTAPVVREINVADQKALGEERDQRFIKQIEPLAKESERVKGITDEISRENYIKQGVSLMAKLRRLNQFPQEWIDAGYTDEEAFILLDSIEQQKKIAEQASGVIQKEVAERVAESNARIPTYQGAAIESGARLGALQSNPDIVSEIATNELLGQRFLASTGGMSPAQAAQGGSIPRLSRAGVLFEKSPIPSEFEDMMPALLPTGQTVSSPDGTPLPRVTPSRPFERPVSQAGLGGSVTASQPQAQQLASDVTPMQAGDWTQTYQEIKQALANIHPSTRYRVWDVILEELAKEIRLPKQQIGSSRFNWDNKTVLKRMLEDPSTAQAVIAQFSEIPAERMEAIKQKAFKFAKY